MAPALYRRVAHGKVLSADFEREAFMDFIERIFGIAPDGGSGTLEFLLFALPIAGIGWVVVRRQQRARRK